MEKVRPNQRIMEGQRCSVVSKECASWIGLTKVRKLLSNPFMTWCEPPGDGDDNIARERNGQDQMTD